MIPLHYSKLTRVLSRDDIHTICTLVENVLLPELRAQEEYLKSEFGGIPRAIAHKLKVALDEYFGRTSTCHYNSSVFAIADSEEAWCILEFDFRNIFGGYENKEDGYIYAIVEFVIEVDFSSFKLEHVREYVVVGEYIEPTEDEEGYVDYNTSDIATSSH